MTPKTNNRLTPDQWQKLMTPNRDRAADLIERMAREDEASVDPTRQLVGELREGAAKSLRDNESGSGRSSQSR